MERRTVVGALVAVLCLACSWSSVLIVANTGTGALAIRAKFGVDLVRGGVLPIRFADVKEIDDDEAWHVAPAGAVTVDTRARTVHMTLPPETATRLGSASNCDRPITCDDNRFRLISLEVAGRSGSLRADRGQLRAAFARDSPRRWVLWYPWTDTHGFWQNLRPAQAVIFCLAILVTAFTVWAAVVVARTPMPRRWGWVAIALLGIGEFTINWTTGGTSARLLSLELFGASMAHSGPLGPWVVTCSFPLGAILALLHRRRSLVAALPASGLAMDSPAAPAA